MSDPRYQPLPENTDPTLQFDGPLRAKVVFRTDPLQIGRIKVEIPGVHKPDEDTDVLPWVRPSCTAWEGGGDFVVPPIGAWVTVTCEGGDHAYPVYAGGWWVDKDLIGELNNDSRWRFTLFGGAKWEGEILKLEAKADPKLAPNNFARSSPLGKRLELDDRKNQQKITLSDQLSNGLFINTTGIGVIEHEQKILPQKVRPGDAILVSGDLGRHGMAIMAVREGLQFESTIESDSAPVHEVVLALIKAGIEIHCLRDLTRGGLASALNEIAEAAGVKIAVEEKSIPVREDVHAACEMLGLDPLHVANEGRFVAFVAPQEAGRALEILRRHDVAANAAVIGRVAEKATPLVIIKSAIGANRILDMPSGEQLPRIC